MTAETVLEVRDLHTHFFLRRGVIKAVDGVSFALRRGEVLGLVGEIGLWQESHRVVGDAPAAQRGRSDGQGRGAARR